MTGLPPGTAVHVVSTNGDTFRVTATGSTLPFDVPKAKLTTDATFAARLAQNEYAAQEAAAQVSAEQMEVDPRAQAAKRAEPERQAADVGYFVPQGGGPVIPATPENLARFGVSYGTGSNAAKAIQAQVDREKAAARQQQAELQRARAAKRIAAENAQKRSEAAAQQQALQRRYQEEQEQRPGRFDTAGEERRRQRQLQQNWQNQRNENQQNERQ
ncbi:MAG: hypothetical protein WA849_17860 [Candidatus Udaeobacter sp.]